MVIDDLRDKGFNDILTIVDASLKYQIEDKSILDEMKRKERIKESPARTDADNFIIKYAKDNNAFIITNDTFKKDWKDKDEWVKENIDRHRMPFMISDGVVEYGEKMDKFLKE